MPDPTNQPESPQSTPELGHSYDGIQEYDNPTPDWWTAIFLATVLFSPLYVFWFHAPQAERTLDKQYERALASNLRLQFGELGELSADEATLLRFMNDSEWLAFAKSTFITHCASCHGKQGEGISGPNMTDDYYLHVKQLVDIASVVQNGAKNGAMPAWGARLHPTEIVLVSSYVASLRGQDLESRRPAEGVEVPAWPSASIKSSEETP